MPRNSIYVICSTNHYESNYKNICPHNRENLEKTKVIFDKNWTEKELNQLQNDKNIILLTHEKVLVETSKLEWTPEEEKE